MKRKMCFLLALCVLSLTTGCNQVRQLNERLIVSGIGVDIEDGAYVVTMHVFDAERASAGGESDNKTLVVTGRGRSVIDAFSAITLQTGREPLYSQNLLLVVGEETAQKGINNVIDFFIRYYEARPSVDVFVAKGLTAREIMNSERDGQTIAAKEIAALADSGMINAKQAKSDMLTLVNRLQDDDSDGYLTALSLQQKENGDSVIYVDGAGVLREDRLVGYLDPEETQGLLFLSGDVKEGTLVVAVEEMGNVSFALSEGKSSLKARVESGVPVFDVLVEAGLNLYEIDGNIHQKYGLEMIDALQKQADKVIREKCVQTAEKVIREYESDLLRLGRRLMQSEPDYFKAVEDWRQLYPQCKLNIIVKTKIEREGQEINPL